MDLIPRYDSRKSFYGKAKVQSEKGVKTLYSYGTPVATVENGKARIRGTYSSTTLRHIKDFLQQEGFSAGTKKDIEKKYKW